MSLSPPSRAAANVIASLLAPTSTGNHSSSNQPSPGTSLAFPAITASATRSRFANCRRILIKSVNMPIADVEIGNSTVTQEDGTFALSRIGSLVEQIHTLTAMGKEVMLISSGAMAKGSQILMENSLLSASMRSHIRSPLQTSMSFPPRACAAAGQSGMMALFEMLFWQKGISVSQILLTDNDVTIKEARSNVRDTIENLLQWGIVPIINQNGAISTSRKFSDGDREVSWDNDTLASVIAVETSVDLLIILTDRDGVYARGPAADPQLIPLYYPGLRVSIDFRPHLENYYHPGIGGEEDTAEYHRDEVQNKVEAALFAVENHVPACVVASGYRSNIVLDIIRGETIGTLFVKNPEAELTESPQAFAQRAREESHKLRNIPISDRRKILLHIEAALAASKQAIMDANLVDVRDANRHQLNPRALDRLRLTEEKFASLLTGIHTLAESPDPVGKVLAKMEVAPGLVLQQETTPLGVVLGVIENEPEALVRLAALALKSGNGLLLKAGKESFNTNTVLHHIITTATTEVTQNSTEVITRDIFILLTPAEDVVPYLELSKDVDVVIPRGSYELIRAIQCATTIPVLGHAEGRCHIYLHEDADVNMAIRLLIDAAMESPIGGTVVQTILIHKHFLEAHAKQLVRAITAAGLRIQGDTYTCSVLSRRGIKLDLYKIEWPTMKRNHRRSSENNQSPKPPQPSAAPNDMAGGDKNSNANASTKSKPPASPTRSALALIAVDSADDAIDHINEFGSGLTDAIVCNDKSVAVDFQNYVDSAFVLHNASTRFSGGHHFGLGANMGVSASRIHARGPIGVEALLTTKWRLTSSNATGHTLEEFSHGTNEFTHIKLSGVTAKL